MGHRLRPEPRQRAHFSGQTSAKTPAQRGVWRRNIVQRVADHDHIAERQTQSLRRIFSPIFELNGPFWRYARWSSSCRLYRGWSFRGQSFAKFGFQFKQAYGIFVSRSSNQLSFVSALSPTVILPARYHAYVYLSIEKFETLQCVVCDRAALDSVQGMLPVLWSCFVGWNDIACARNGLSMPFFSSKTADIILYGFAGTPRLGRYICSSRWGLNAT